MEFDTSLDDRVQRCGICTLEANRLACPNVVECGFLSNVSELRAGHCVQQRNTGGEIVQFGIYRITRDTRELVHELFFPWGERKDAQNMINHSRALMDREFNLVTPDQRAHEIDPVHCL
jgi:hypothetical protein